jgi:hypothetical protein
MIWCRSDAEVGQSKQHTRHRRAVLDVEHRRDSAERIRVGTSLLAPVIKMTVTSVDEVFGTHNAG